jgi:hypothetical protein
VIEYNTGYVLRTPDTIPLVPTKRDRRSGGE